MNSEAANSSPQTRYDTSRQIHFRASPPTWPLGRPSQLLSELDRSREKGWSPAIILTDSTRKQSPFIKQLINLIEPKTDDIKIIFACGTHLPADQSFIRRVLGEDIYKRYEKSIKVSSTQNPASKYEWIGVTDRGTPVELNKELFDRDLL